MRNYLRTVILSSLTILLLFGCAAQPAVETGAESSQPREYDILLQDQEFKFQREQPFQKRDFDPYLKGEWIGEAISYGPFREGQAPGVKGPSEAEILEDLNILKANWNLIRVYGSDDDTERILKVISEYQLPFKVMLGVWLENETDNAERRMANLEQVSRGIELANRFPGIVAAVNVGNESQVFWSWHRMAEADLIRYIRALRQFTNIPITTADDYNFWNKPEAATVAAEVDFIVLHAYALWNSQTLSRAISWTDSVYQDIQARFPEMTIALGETGWATDYNPEKTGPGEQGTLIKGKVGIEAQETFIRELSAWVQQDSVTTFLFEAFDEPWKGGGVASGPREVEKNWGVYYENRTPKPSLENFLIQSEK